MPGHDDGHWHGTDSEWQNFKFRVQGTGLGLCVSPPAP